MRYYKVTITFMDGSVRQVPHVTDIDQRDGILTLYKRWYGAMGSQEEHLGSYPMLNVRHWMSKDEDAL